MSPPPDVSQPGTWSAPYSAATPTNFQPGSFFGPRYRIEALLGQGGMGAVYRAYDSELGRTVALKLVRPELATSPQTMARFKQELLLASKISHKNILRIHDLGDLNGIKFITMAYVEGADLANLIGERGRLPFPQALKFAKQLCAALDAAHSEGVVHRDLKPQNILVDRADNVYVSDFGLAKSLESEATMMTRTGQILGTPRYMSPEQVEAGAIDHRSDLYSLGLILYEMFTADVPFRGESTLQLMYQRVNEKPKDPRTVCPELPEYLAAIILKCLERDPARRYQNAREILADLEAERAPADLLGKGWQAKAPAAPDLHNAETISIQIPKLSGRTRRRLIVFGWLLFGLGAASGARWWKARSHRAADTAAPAALQHYLAVLPFRAVGDPASTIVADGVVDSLSAKLAGLRNVYVASANAVNAAVGKQDVSAADPAKLARALGVTLLVTGTVQGAGDRIAITLSLDETGKKARNLLNKEFDGHRADLLTLESNAFSEVVKALEIKLTNDESARSVNPTENSDAYELYLQGRSRLHSAQSAQGVQAFTAAAGLFTGALKADPRFALAYAGLADTYLHLWDSTKDAGYIEKARGAAQQAEELNDQLPEVYFALGSIDSATGKTTEAIVELQHALTLAPNSDEALRRLGIAYTAAGKPKEAIESYTKATRINPYFWANYNQLGFALFRLGQNEKALQAFRHVTELDPDRAAGYANQGAVYLREGEWKQAVPMFQKAITLQPIAAYYANLGFAYFFLEQYSQAVPLFKKAVEMAPNDFSFRGDLADAYRWSGDAAKAKIAYDQAIALAFKSYQVNTKDAELLGQLGLFYAKEKDDRQAIRFIRQARALDPVLNTLMYDEATINALAGRTSEAVADLNQALKNGYSWREASHDPELKPLRGLPDFENLAKQYSGTSGR
ncbi:MAG TPA: protein kinase [Bryobacteraceae bacterium]|nr:protein kinase [Bryobacteraceae bacterium]